MKKSILLICITFPFFTGCLSLSDKPATQFQKELDYIVSSKFAWTPGASMTVFAPDDAIQWTRVAGVTSVEGLEDLQINQPFRVASVDKSFVSAAILRLQEEQLLHINDPIANYISEEHTNILINGGYSPYEITIKNCMNHTSGLYDYIFGDEAFPSPYFHLVKKNPNKKWTKTEQLKGAMEWGKPRGKPNEVYDYNDTGYLLLVEIIERVSKLDFGTALSQLLNYEKIGLHSTWLERSELPKSKLPLIDCYYRRENFSDYDISMDCVGGVVSTTTDVSKFFYALFNGQVFKQAETLQLMIQPTVIFSPKTATTTNVDYGLGMHIYTIYGKTFYAAMGLWGTHALYAPDQNFSITIHFTEGGTHFVMKRMISLMNNFLAKKQNNNEQYHRN